MEEDSKQRKVNSLVSKRLAWGAVRSRAALSKGKWAMQEHGDFPSLRLFGSRAFFRIANPDPNVRITHEGIAISVEQ